MALTTQQKQGWAKVAAGLAASGATALAVMQAITPTMEGMRTDAYQDVAGNWTICIGETWIDGRHVRKGDHRSEAYCIARFNIRAQYFLTELRKPLKTDQPPLRMGSLGDFGYNVGIENYKHSSTLRLINASKVREGCEAMGLYNKARVWDPALKRIVLVPVWGLTVRRWVDTFFCEWELPR